MKLPDHTSRKQRCRFLCVLLMGVVLFPLLRPEVAVAYDGLSDLLGEVFRGLTRPRPAPQAIQMLPPPPAAELESRRVRLEGFVAARKHWMNSVAEFSPEQNQQLDAFFVKAIVSLQESYKVRGQQHNNGVHEFLPVLFCTNGGASGKISDPLSTSWSADVPEILTAAQRERIQEFDQQRKLAILQGRRDWIVQLFDNELHLTSAQYPLVSEHIEKRLTAESSQLYSFTNQNYYLRYVPPHSLLANFKENEVLLPEQRERLNQLRRGDHAAGTNGRYLTFMSNEGVEQWYEKLDESVAAQTDRLHQIAAVQIAYFEAEHGLSEQTIQHLKLGARGTVLYCMNTWKESTTKQLNQWEDRVRQQRQQLGGGNFGFSVSFPESSVIDRHELWKSTLAQIEGDLGDEFNTRKTRARDARLAYLLSLLDSELWLTKQQREEFSALLSAKMPQNDLQGLDYIYELALVAIALVKLTDEEIEKVLSPPQVAVWKGMQKQLLMRQDNAGNLNNHIFIQLNNGGQFSFIIPK